MVIYCLPKSHVIGTSAIADHRSSTTQSGLLHSMIDREGKERSDMIDK